MDILRKAIAFWRVPLMVTVLSGAICAVPSVQAAKAPEAKTMVTSKQQLNAFDSVVVSGNIKLTVLPAAQSASQLLTITRPSSQNYSVSVKQHLLTIRQTTPWWVSTKPAEVTVNVHMLKKLSLYDAAAVSAQSLNTTALAIDADTSGDIILDGKVGLTSLVLKGPGNVHIRWVDSPRLNIDSTGDSAIELSGKVGQMHVRLSHHSSLQAQYLRADSIAIQAYRFAKAQVMPLTTLNAYAHDFSHIFYYKTPKYFTRFTSQSGNILQMQWRES